MTHTPIDDYFQKFTRYHWYLCTILFMSKIPTFWHLLNLIFVSPPMNFHCKSAPNNITEENYCPCENPEWNRSVFTETAQTKYGLYCETKWLISFSESMISAGTLIGAFVMGFFSDRYGRKLAFSVCCLALGISGSLVVVMPDIYSFIVMRFLEGIGVGGVIIIAYVYLVEFCGTNYRETVSALFHIPLNISHCSLAGISYLLRDFQYFQLATSIPVLIFALSYWLLHDSPKWLLDEGEVEKAIDVMLKINKFNIHTFENVEETLQAYHTNTIAASKPDQVRMSFWQIFKYKWPAINFACMSVVYFSSGMGYYGVSQYIGHMSGKIHVNVAISGAVLIPGTLAATIFLNILGRKIFLMATCLLAGLFMILVICVSDKFHLLRISFACIGNCFFFMTFIVAFLYSVELFPTAIRNSVLGVLSVLSRVGQIIAPFVNDLPQTASGLIFGIFPMIAGLLCLILPETKNKDLPVTCDDMLNENMKHPS